MYHTPVLPMGMEARNIQLIIMDMFSSQAILHINKWVLVRIQTAAGYQCSGYVDQNNYWHDGSGGSYSLQHSNYPFEHTNSTTTSNTTASSVHYQQAPNHWSANYGAAVSNVIPTPGSGNMVATTVPISTYPSQNLNGGYSYASSQPPPPGTTSWRGNLSSPLLPSSKAPDDMSKFLNTCAVEKTSTVHNYRLNQIPLDLQKPLKSNLPSGENHEGSGNDTYTNVPPSSLQISQASLNPQQPLQAVSVMDARRVSKMQIPTNPRIASSLALGMPKLDKESSTTNAAAKPAYISVQVPKLHNQLSSSDNADANVKALPPSVCDYVRRCLSRCKDDASRTACQLMLSELIAKAKDDGSLWTKNWDLEPPLPLANSSSDATNLNILQNTVSSITKFPNKRSKSRWEPVAEKKLDSKFAPVNLESSKNVSWAERMAGSRILEGMDNGWTSMKFPLVQQQSTLIKSSEKPVKKQRLFGPLSTTENDSNSAEGGKEPELNTHHSSAITLANSPEEKKKREHRSRRFDKSQESHADTEQFKPKGAGVANIYLRRASAMLLAKNFDDRCGRAVEDMDWDALTVKGTCQEIEKRYLRLTSAPDPATVRPEEILEKALSMVQTSQKNYYYKCDQLKSIRQDLTVQRIQNELTVKVYETHARLALEAGDLPEFNQCQSQLKRLYAEGIKGCRMEFSAYNLLCVILHSNNKRDLLSSMNSLSYEAKQDEAVKLALAVRSAVSLGNYVLFFRLYKSAPSLFTCLMDLHVEKMRFEAIKCMSKSYRPTVPVVYISQVLGFSNSAQTDADDGRVQVDRRTVKNG
ncbi:hypothetical protein HPP92_015055 [Vanilla planifolia]|uniref:PCI domain-containing protein n=1 Tax=Vanilla planifolia TaxID=51239 RepID=A0A835QMM6_VANPL|nr:hypothetical protein HPP92_015055 [Vanilla planifolia]